MAAFRVGGHGGRRKLDDSDHDGQEYRGPGAKPRKSILREIFDF